MPDNRGWWIDHERRMVKEGDPIWGTTVCVVYGMGAEYDENVNLIVAAPELFAVLKRALAAAGTDELSWLPSAKSAIAKATGEPS